MTPRERYVKALTFGNPDKIPFMPGGPRESTLKRWRKEGMPEGEDHEQQIRDAIGVPADSGRIVRGIGINIGMIPSFEVKVLEHENGHYIAQDALGNVVEFSDQFDLSYLSSAKDFVTRRWIKCPVENRDDFEAMKARYNIDSPGRFPADFEQRCQQLAHRDIPLSLSNAGSFWKMRDWCGFEGLCMMMIDQPDLVADMAAFWTDFISKIQSRILAHIVPDVVSYSEDMAYKAKAMISPTMCREFIMPSWKTWTKVWRQAGVTVIDVDSDGFIGELIPLWIESGINSNGPVEVAAHNDINEFRRRHGDRMAYTGGVDKRCMAKGGRVIRDELKRIEPVVQGGGYIPGCDHGVPSDISWPDFVDYGKLLAKMTGWL